MTREEETKEAYKDYMNNGGMFQSNPWFYFKAGTEWADKHPTNAWHNPIEKPRAKEWILIQFVKGDYTAISLNEHGVDIWFDVWCKEDNVYRWAYIEDLLPKGGER